MKPKSSYSKSPSKAPAERVMKDIRRQTRRQFSAEGKIRIVLEGLRGDDSIAELCRKEGIAQSLYFTWSKEFMEAGKRRLAGDTARAATTGEVQNLRRETRALKECVADLTLENRLLKRAFVRMGATTNEVSCIGEARDHPDRRAVAPARKADAEPTRHRPPDVYRWYDHYLEGGPEALEDRPSAPSRVWNHIGDDIQDQIVEMALEQSELSPRELAVRFTDERQYFVSEASVYRLIKAHNLITSPAYVVIKAADQFHTKTSRVNEMWQTDFTYFKIIGWGWMYLSTVLDDFSRYIIAWKLCTNIRAEDVTDTLYLALAASGCDSATVLHKPRLLSDNALCWEAAAATGQQISLRRTRSALMTF